MFIIVLWVSVISIIYFFIMKKLDLLRVPLLEEVIGLDVAEMGSKVRIQKQIAAGIVRAATLRFHESGSFVKERKEALELGAIKPVGTARTENELIEDN